MGKTGYYSITTKKFSLCTRHNDWLWKTQELYNEVLCFYYNLYLDCLTDNKKGTQESLRALEKMTIVGRDKIPVPCPIPWEGLPLYFRRAAINAAIASAKSYLSRKNQRQRTEKFTESVTFYKGMYRDLTEKEITLKLWNGEGWLWTHCRLKGNFFPENAQPMSPCLVLKEKRIELHVPVKNQVEDGRNTKERMAANEKICAAVFTNKDTSVVCCVLNAKGKMQSTFFIRGGAEYVHRCSQILQRLEKSEASSGGKDDSRANQKYWMKLKHLNEYYSHKFSRQVIDYCRKNDVKTLVLPEFDEKYKKYVMLSVGNWSPLHLSTQVREKLKYKAWQEGIVVLEIPEHHMSSFCNVCGKKVKRSGSEYVCENGHQGNVYLNMAQNLGKKCLCGFGKQVI